MKTEKEIDMIEQTISVIGKIPGFYKGSGISKDSTITEDDIIQLKISEEYFYGDLLVAYWPNTKVKSPFCIISSDDGKTPIPFKIAKFNTQTGEFEMFDQQKMLIELAEEGVIDVSPKWLKDIKKMRQVGIERTK